MKNSPPGASVLTSYNALVASGKITHDAAQEKVIKKLDALASTLTMHRRKYHGIFSRTFKRRQKSGADSIYIYGGVGRGKSMLMDMFFSVIPVTRKRRTHFHAFMLDVHERIHRWRAEKHKSRTDPIIHIAKEIAKENWVLCFDEFQVSDIADAMILGKLFRTLFAEGVIVVATSNRHPGELYKDGLQRQRFLPFIEMFKEKLDIIELTGKKDFRLAALKSLSTMYFTPIGRASKKFMEKTFSGLTGTKKTESCALFIQGRKLNVRRMYGKVAQFFFSELCEQPLGAADYIEIARSFNTILLSKIPQMGKEKRNEAKRFTTLIDELYEHKVKLICTAEVLPHSIYTGRDGAFEFERTVSRLMEMQSEEYLKQSHVS